MQSRILKPFFSFAAAERIVFYLLLAANLLPFWAFHYFLTCDGPCHLYNSKVLLDFWRGGDVKAFYDQWLYLNARFEPNWFGHAFMMLLQGLHVPGYLAEKLFANALCAWVRAWFAPPHPANQPQWPVSEFVGVAVYPSLRFPDGLLQLFVQPGGAVLGDGLLAAHSYGVHTGSLAGAGCGFSDFIFLSPGSGCCFHSCSSEASRWEHIGAI